MFRLEFDPDNTLLCATMARALMSYAAAKVELGDGATTGRTDGTTESTSNTPADDVESETYDPAGEAHTPVSQGGHLMPTESDGVLKPSPARMAVAAEMATDDKVDHNGVAFDAKMCAVAAKPFYASGKRSGQWKKKHGVDDATYDAWYAGELLVSEPAPAAAADTSVDTAGAFSATDTPAGPATDPVPTDLGTFMKWFAEMQAGGRLTQDQLTNAYAVCGLSMADILPPNTPDVIAANILAVHTNLSVIAG